MSKSSKNNCSTYTNPLCILYGSATGNSEHIAKDLTKQIQKDLTVLHPSFDNVICCELDQYKKLGCLALWEQPSLDDTPSQQQQQEQLQYQYHGVLIICSTTGNGDPPENAGRFVRHMKKAATTATAASALTDPNNKSSSSLLLFQNVCYAVLGLGDTNYDQYCAAAVTIDRAIHQLGGHRCLVYPSTSKSALTCADEGSGQLEDVVEPWIATIVSKIVQACRRNLDDDSRNNNNNNNNSTAIPVAVADTADVTTELLHIGETNGTTTGSTGTTTTMTDAATDIITEPYEIIINQVSLGIQMVQSILYEQQQLSDGSKETTSSSSSLLDIDPNTLPSTTSLIDEFAAATMKPFTFIVPPENDTIKENEVFIDDNIQQRIRGLSIGSHPNNNSTTTVANNTVQPDDSVSSVSAGYYYTVHNPYESQVIQARYLTNTSTIAAQQVVESIIQIQQQQQQQDNEPLVYHKEVESIYDNAFPLTTANDKSITDRNGKRVIEITLTLPDDSTLEYAPGDSLGIVVDNPMSSVQYMLKILQQNDPSIHNPNQQMIFINNENGLHRTAAPISVVDAISRHIDLCSFIKSKRIIYALSQLATDPIEQQYLQVVSSKSTFGETLFRRLIDEQRLNLVDLIQLFPSVQCNITLEILFHLVPNNIPPRYYSVSSSPLQQQHHDPYSGSNHHCLTVAFSVVDYITPSIVTGDIAKIELGQRRVHGVATRYLESISSTLLCSPNTKATNGKEINATTTVVNKENELQQSQHVAIPKIRIFPKPTIDFRMPHSLSTPLILIGPGTGIAPFIGFLRHRQILIRQQRNMNGSSNSEYSTAVAAHTIVEGTWRGGYELHNDENELAISQQDESGLNVGADYRMKSSHTKTDDEYGSVDVLFGCRYEDHDWLYRDEMNELLDEGIISKLYTSFSRDNKVNNNARRYVQDILLTDVDCGKRFVDLIIHHEAAVYVCGDGNTMAQDVQSAIIQLLSTTSQFQDDQDMSKAYLDEMKRKQRFLMDIWS